MPDPSIEEPAKTKSNQGPPVKTDPPEDIRQAVVDASASPAWADIARTRIEQITKYGHTPEQDEMLSMHEIPLRVSRIVGIAAEDLSLGGWDLLERARAKLVKAAAMIVAQIDRIDRKLAERAEREDV